MPLLQRLLRKRLLHASQLTGTVYQLLLCSNKTTASSLGAHMCLKHYRWGIRLKCHVWTGMQRTAGHPNHERRIAVRTAGYQHTPVCQVIPSPSQSSSASAWRQHNTPSAWPSLCAWTVISDPSIPSSRFSSVTHNYDRCVSCCQHCSHMTETNTYGTLYRTVLAVVTTLHPEPLQTSAPQADCLQGAVPRAYCLTRWHHAS